MTKLWFAVLLVVCMVGIGCTPVEKAAYDTIVGAKAFLDKEKAQHPECEKTPRSNVCSDLAKATNAKDALIDATEVYCSGPAFLTGAPCQPPAKGTPGYDQAVAKLKAAIASYNQTAKDLQGAL